MKKRDMRTSLKVCQATRQLVNKLTAHYDLSQDEVVQMLAERECKLLGIPIEKKQ